MIKTIFSLALMAVVGVTAAEEEEQVVQHAKFHSYEEKVSVDDYMRNESLIDLRETGALEALKKEGLHLIQHQDFEILVTENPSTGYSWQFDKDAAKGLWTIEQEYQDHRQSSEHHMVGAPGLKHIAIHAHPTLEGEGIFRAVYARPWMFHGFDDFKEEDYQGYEAKNLIQFSINISAP